MTKQFLSTTIETLGNKQAGEVSTTSFTLEAITVEFAPGTGGFGSPYVHATIQGENPPHFILTGATPETAIAVAQFFDDKRPVRIGITDRHTRRGHQVAKIISVHLT
ncbi:hypothetical protein U2F10_02925 [Leptothoe sp. EHU-05/26/07-4]